MGPGGLKTSASTLVELYNSLGIENRGTVDLRQFLDEHEVASDMLLAEIIESDGRLRAQYGLPISLDRYFDAILDLRQRPDALDAAIDLALRGASSRSNADSEAVASLVKQYPDLAAEIHDAAMLNNALLSTAGLRKRVTTAAAYRLPCDFGPTLENGELRYRLEELLGAGAFGEVYLATDRNLSDEDHDAQVAIKILSPRHDDPYDRRQLAEEAMKARRINHPYVVRVFDRGTTEQDEDFIVYELVERGSLQHWLRKKRPPVDPREAAQLMVKIARGVQAAHGAGLIHCDLKPGNIMITPDGDPKISDFGIAIRAGEQLHRRTGSGSWFDSAPIGNQAFIAPEQYRREEGSLTVASDVYALGGILFYLLTGQLPNGQTPEEIERTHDRRTGRTSPPSSRQLNPTVDHDLDRITRRAMAIVPAERHSSAGALADDLQAWLSHEPIQWMKPSLPRVMALWARRRPAVAAMLMLLLVAAFTGSLIAQHLITRRVQADLNYGEVAGELDRIRSDAIQRGREMAQATRTEPFLAGYLGHLLVTDYVLGPRVFDDTTAVMSRWQVKRAILDQHIRHFEEIGLGEHWNTHLYRAVLAVWLLNEGSVQPGDLALLKEAGEMIRRARLGLANVFAEDDYIHRDLEALEGTIAIELHLMERPSASSFTSQERDHLLMLGDRVMSQVEEMKFRDATHPVRTLAARTLIRLFDVTNLNDPERLATAQRMASLPTSLEKLMNNDR